MRLRVVRIAILACAAVLIFLTGTAAAGIAQAGNPAPEFWVPADPPKVFYKIEAKIDIPNRMISGRESISFTNHSSREMSLLALDWDIKGSRSIEVVMAGKPLILLNPVEKPPVSSPLVYQLPQPLKPGAALKLDITFKAGDKISRNVEQIKLVAWFPRIWWGGMPTFDSFAVRFETPAGYTAAAGGRLNPETGYYENQGGRTFGIFLGKDLKTAQKESAGVQIFSLFTEKGAQCAKLCLETAADVVKFFKEWFGFYPFDFLYILPGGAGPWGGYPFASGMVFIHGQEQFDKAPLYHWKWITAHEIGHQYWGEYVLDDDRPSWLWIGMGIYADREYTITRNLGPQKHTGLINRYLKGVKERLDTTVDIPPAQLDKIDYDHNNVVVHGKGYSIIIALQSVLGKETFDGIYKKCAREYGGKRLGYKEFWRVCEAESGQSLKWFFDQWVRSNEYLCYRVTGQQCSRKKKGYVSRVTVECKGTMEMPVPVKAVFEDGSNLLKVTNRLFKVNHLEFDSRSPLKEVILDPEKKLAMLDNPLPPLAEDIPVRIRRLPWSGNGVEALQVYEAEKTLTFEKDPGWFKLGLCLFDGGYYKEAFAAFQKMLDKEPSGLYRFAGLVWLGHLKDLQGKRAEALVFYKEALKHDTGQTMRHSQWGMVINRQWVEERLKTPFVWGDKK